MEDFFSKILFDFDSQNTYGLSPLNSDILVKVAFSPISPTVNLTNVELNFFDRNNILFLNKNLILYDDGKDSDERSGDFVFTKNIQTPLIMSNTKANLKPVVFFKSLNTSFNYNTNDFISIDTLAPPDFSFDRFEFNLTMSQINLELSYLNYPISDQIKTLNIYRQNSKGVSSNKFLIKSILMDQKYIFISSEKTIVKIDFDLSDWYDFSSGFYSVGLFDLNEQASLSNDLIEFTMDELPRVVKKNAKVIPWDGLYPPILGTNQVSLMITNDSIIIQKKSGTITKTYKSDKSLNSIIKLSDSVGIGTPIRPQSCSSNKYPLKNIDWLPCNPISTNPFVKNSFFQVELKYSDRLTPEGNTYWPDYFINVVYNQNLLTSTKIIQGGQLTNGPYIDQYHVDGNNLYVLVQYGHGPGATESWWIQHYQLL